MSTTPGLTLGARAPDFTELQRAALGGFLAGVALRGAEAEDPVARVLEQDPAAVAARTLSLADIALQLLPIGLFTPEQKAIYARQDDGLLGTQVLNVTEAMSVLAPLGVTFDVPPERLLALQDQQGAFESFKLLGMQVTNSAMDQRALFGAFLAFLLEGTIEAVDRRYHDAAVPQAERDALLDDFAPALLALDDVLRYPIERKQELGARREALGEEAKEAQADAALAETTLRLRQALYVPREELFAAARRHLARTGQDPAAVAAGAAGGPGAPALAPPGSRRIPLI